MRVVFINHHLFQDGDTYGLIYALLLNQALGVEDPRLGLFWINDDLYAPNQSGGSAEIRDYTRKVETRLGYFDSFGQLGTQLFLVRCRFTDDVDLVEVRAGNNELFVTANKTLFNSNPRLVSLFLTKEENDPSFWLKQLEGSLDERVKVSESALNQAAGALGISLDTWISASEDEERLRAYLRTHCAYPEQALRFLMRGEGPLAREYFKRRVSVAFGLDREMEVHFAYISKSTDYVRRCVEVKGFAVVARTLAKAVLTCTQAYASDNQKFINSFLGDLEGRKGKAGASGAQNEQVPEPLIVLFWIRGAKKDEESAILGTYDRNGDKTPSPGKPQHHTNLTLYKQLRFLIKTLSADLKTPIWFVPIGDELNEDLGKEVGDFSRTVELSASALEHAALVLGIPLSQSISLSDRHRLGLYLKAHYSYTESDVEKLLELRGGYKKGVKSYNLIKFFEREPFRGKPMGAQINFLLQLASQRQVIQVGMRSGSMERLMYLGVPTIYFDRTQSDPELPNPVGATRIKQLCFFQGDSLTELLDYFNRCNDALTPTGVVKGYPLFFQIENRDTGFLKYSSLGDTRVGKMIDKLTQHEDLREYNQLKQKLLQKGFLSNHLMSVRQDVISLGGLVDKEALKLLCMLWFMSTIYPRYAGILGEKASGGNRSQVPNFYASLFEQHKDMRLREIRAKQEERRQKKQGTAPPKPSPSVSSSGNNAVMGGGGQASAVESTVNYQLNDRVRIDYHRYYDVVGRVTQVSNGMVSVFIEHCYAPNTTRDVHGEQEHTSVVLNKVVSWKKEQILRRER